MTWRNSQAKVKESLSHTTNATLYSRSSPRSRATLTRSEFGRWVEGNHFHTCRVPSARPPVRPSGERDHPHSPAPFDNWRTEFVDRGSTGSNPLQRKETTRVEPDIFFTSNCFPLRGKSKEMRAFSVSFFVTNFWSSLVFPAFLNDYPPPSNPASV